MKTILTIISALLLLVGCKQTFQQTAETALARSTPSEKTATSVVFIAGFDEGRNTYYDNAKAYYKSQGMLVVDDLFSLDAILAWLQQQSNSDAIYDEIHIVTHSNPWLGMSLRIAENGQRITAETLQMAKANAELPILECGINKQTKIIFHSCGLGQNWELLQELKGVFKGEKTPKVYASSFFNVYGGKYAPHYLATPYYNYYPTAESEGPAALAKEFDETYNKTNIDWRTAIESRNERSMGEAYSYKFNIPVVWEFSFATTAEIPELADKEAIMGFVSESPEMADALYRLNIPLEKYRWKIQIQGNTLIIKGKTTVLCVLEPILQEKDENEYRQTDLNDIFLYQIL